MADRTTVEASYFANAADGLMLPEVVEATMWHLRREAEVGAPAAAMEASATLAKSYSAAAELIGAAADEVAFVESGNRAIAALIQSAGLKPGDHVRVDRTCWGGTLGLSVALQTLLATGADVVAAQLAERAEPPGETAGPARHCDMRARPRLGGLCDHHGRRIDGGGGLD